MLSCVLNIKDLFKNYVKSTPNHSFPSHLTSSITYNDWLMRFNCSASLIWVLKEENSIRNYSLSRNMNLHFMNVRVRVESLYDDPSLQCENLLPVIIIKTLILMQCNNFSIYPPSLSSLAHPFYCCSFHNFICFEWFIVSRTFVTNLTSPLSSLVVVLVQLQCMW